MGWQWDLRFGSASSYPALGRTWQHWERAPREDKSFGGRNFSENYQIGKMFRRCHLTHFLLFVHFVDGEVDWEKLFLAVLDLR